MHRFTNRHRSFTVPRALVAAAASLALALAACTGGGGAGGDMKVEGVWARPSMAMQGSGAAYMVITNETGRDDALIGASSPAAANVEIHETMETSSGMGMMPVERVALPDGQSVELKPGGIHVMLINLTGPIESGTSIEITLDFETAPDLTVTAEVRAS